MSQPVKLDTQRLEEREVPAAALFADVMPGIWGSYPLNLTPSGAKLFFSADNGHGYEPYVTDGTPGSARMVKDVKPGLGGSNPTSFVAADNGVVYFTANDGTQTTLWKSDGTRDGTTKVPGVPAGADVTARTAIGHNGVLHFAVRNPAGSTVQWWRADGTTTALLHHIAVTADSRPEFRAIDGEIVLVNLTNSFDQVVSLFRYDAATGTVSPWQYRQVGQSGETGAVELGIGTELAPGKFVHGSRFTATGTSLWLYEGSGTVPRLLEAFRSAGEYAYFADAPVRYRGLAYFGIQSDDPTLAGLWVTDGTAAGTRKSDLPVGAGRFEPGSLSVLGGRLLVRTTDDTNGHRFFFSDGTAGGTAEAPQPPDATGPVYFAGTIPAGSDAPRGALLVRATSPTGPLYRTDGSEAGTAWVDPAGLPSGYKPGSPFAYHLDGFGRVIPNFESSGVYFNGGLYFSAHDGERRPELWKWDATGPVVPPPTVVAPKVTSVTVTDGSPQRSVVTGLTIAFDRKVNIEDGALMLKDAAGKAILLYIEDPASGSDQVSVHFGGGSLPDGRYTLTVRAGRVTDAVTGGVMELDHTFAFTRLFGDLNGDGTFDRDARWMVRNAIGTAVGGPGYIAALDYNGDGQIDATDELQIVRRWGKSV